MSAVHLVGGGRDETAAAPLFRRFVADAAAVAGRTPRIALLLVLEADDDTSADRFVRALRSGGATDVAVHAIAEGAVFSEAVLDGADAVMVGGGLTPAYADAVAPIAEMLRAAVTGGMPYLGFSAGAAIAAERALVGGWLRAGVPVAQEDASEELDELTVVPGLGLVPFAVDVHAAQWGTVSRLVAAVEAGMLGEGYAIDETTSVVVRPGADPVVTGVGAAWHVARVAHSTIVRRLTA